MMLRKRVGCLSKPDDTEWLPVIGQHFFYEATDEQRLALSLGDVVGIGICCGRVDLYRAKAGRKDGTG